MITSKCKCAPVDAPVEPTFPMTSPALTFVPTGFPFSIMCAYLVLKPSSCLTSTYLPYPDPIFLLLDRTVVPFALLMPTSSSVNAVMGVPVISPEATSMPAWNDEQPPQLRLPKPDVILFVCDDIHDLLPTTSISGCSEGSQFIVKPPSFWAISFVVGTQCSFKLFGSFAAPTGA